MRGGRKLFISAFLVPAVIVAAFSFVVPADDREAREEPQEISVAGVLLTMAKRLPSIWSIKREARALAKRLPEYEGEVPVPESDTIFSWIEGLCARPHRRPGTPEGHQAEMWVEEQFRKTGLENVTVDRVPITVWTAERWSLTVEGEDIPCFFTVNTGFTGPEGITAPLVYVGTGKPEDFEKSDVEGKIVVADVPFPYLPSGIILKLTGGAYAISDPDGSISLGTGQYLNFVRMNFPGEFIEQLETYERDVYRGSERRGALAICLILRDQPSRYNTHYGPYDGVMKDFPALWIGKYDGERLRDLAIQGKTATFVQAGSKEPGYMSNVWGTLPGVSDEVILVTSHQDSPFEGATEDAAGVAQLLAQAWAWSRVPEERRPKTLVFVAAGGHFYGAQGGRAFAREHSDIIDRTKICITLEHLGAKEVEERDGEYSETGRLALTVMFTSHDAEVIAAVVRSLERKPAKVTVPLPADFFGPSPTSDAAGYVLESDVPVISWIGCPYYLLDSQDTLDKIEKSELRPIAETTTELVRTFMVMD